MIIVSPKESYGPTKLNKCIKVNNKCTFHGRVLLSIMDRSFYLFEKSFPLIKLSNRYKNSYVKLMVWHSF